MEPDFSRNVPRTVAAAVMAACDGSDGVVDGMIGDPQKCSFDPAAIQCSGSEHDGCLTPSQVGCSPALRGARQSAHWRTNLSRHAEGQRTWWEHLGPSANGQPPFAAIFEWVFGGEWNWRSFDFDRSVAGVDKKLAPIVNATSPKLDAFRDRGHKLLVYHGWSDWLVVPGESINYRDALVARFSEKKLDNFYRLFMVPGMMHCGGGVGPDHFDALSAVVDWVERGRAPDRVIASQFGSDERTGPDLRTRPLCPYPQVAKYSGRGSVDDQANFSCAAPGR